MHITLESDYAVRIVNCLVMSKNRMDAKNIAQSTGVTLRFSLKILRKLVAGGIVKSFKGTLGGYEIAKDPKDISLKDVIEVIEGPYMLSRCLGEEYDCTRENSKCCPYQQIYQEVSALVNDKLAQANFKDLCKID